MSRDLIVEARRRAGITQSELARRLGTHQPVIARWEAGRAEPDFRTVVRVVRACGLDLNVSLSVSDDHDVTLIRRELSALPHERLSHMVDAVRALSTMERATRA